VLAKEGVGSEFARDHGLIVFRGPIRNVKILDGVGVQPDVLIATHDVELAGDRIIDANREAATVLDFVFL
jgi:hypothetical protein